MSRLFSTYWLPLLLAANGLAQDRHDVFGDPLPKGAIARLGTTRWRNVNDQYGGVKLEFAPDGTSIICLMPDGSLASSDIATGRKQWQISGPRPIGGFSLTPDGKSLLTRDAPPSLLDGADDKLPFGIRVWDVATRRQIRLIEVYPPIFCLHGDLIAVVDTYFKIEIINWKTGKLVRKLNTTRLMDDAAPPRFLPGGKLVVSLGYGRRGREILDYRSGKSLSVVEPKGEPSRFFFPGNIAVSFFWQKSIRRWDLLTGKELPSLSGYGNEQIWDIAVTPDGKTLVSISSDSIRRWDLATGKQTGRLDPKLEFNDHPVTFAVSNDGGRVAFTCMLTSNLRVFDFEKGGELSPLAGHTEKVTTAHFSQNGKIIVSTGEDHTCRVWDASTGCQILKLNSAGYFDLAGNSFVVNGVVFDLQTGRKRFAIPQLGDDFDRAFIARDAPIIVTTKGFESSDTRLELWDAKTGKRRWMMANPKVSRDGILISPGAHLLWSGSGAAGWVSAELLRKSNVSLEDGSPAFDLATGYLRGTAKVLTTTLALSADGRTLAGHIPYPDESDFSYRKLALIEAASGRERLRIDTGPIRDDRMLADLLPPLFSRDGRLIAAVFPQHGGAIVVFDAATGKLLRRFQGHVLPVSCLEFSSDGTRLLTGSKDCTALVWDLSEFTKARKPKNLTPAELDSLWKELASDDAKLAYRAIISLRDSGPQAIELIRARFKPQAIDLKEIERQIAALGSKEKATGDRAQAALQRIAPQIEPLLDDTFAKQLSPEARGRIEQSLKGITCLETSPERLRELRSIEVLEGVGGDNARALLESYLQSTAHTRLGLEIRQTIERMKNH